MAYQHTLGAVAGQRRSPLLSRLLRALIALDAGYRQRRALQEKSAHQLRDMGIDPAAFGQDRARATWNAPLMMLR